MGRAALSALLTAWLVSVMNDTVQQVFEASWQEYCTKACYQTDVQKKAAAAIRDCKTGKPGCNVSRCSDCGHIQVCSNSCRNRICPQCQAVKKEVWVNKRRAGAIDSPASMRYLPFRMR